MVYLPSIVASDSKGTYHSPSSHIPTASEPASPNPGLPPISPTLGAWEEEGQPHNPLTDVSYVWRGDDHDWDRCHTALKLLRSDGRKLELWAAWIDPPDEEEEGGMLAGIRLSLERKRTLKGKEQERSSEEKKAEDKRKKRGVRWTEDRSSTILDKIDTPTEGGPNPISRFLMDEPLSLHIPSGAELDTSKAPREALENVISSHVSFIIAYQTITNLLDRLKKSFPPLSILTRVPNFKTC
jgi:hypothetical protein